MTPKELKIWAATMAKECDVTIVNRSQIGWVAKMFRKYVLRAASKYVPDLSEALRPCYLRVFRKDLIALTFDVGCEDIPCLSQMRVITHECQHKFDVVDYMRKHGKRAVNWYRNYFSDDIFRAWSEGGPSTAGAEIRYHATGIYSDPVCDFDSYLIDEESALRLFRKGCETRRESVLSQGKEWIATQKAARKAIEIYDRTVGGVS